LDYYGHTYNALNHALDANYALISVEDWRLHIKPLTPFGHRPPSDVFSLLLVFHGLLTQNCLNVPCCDWVIVLTF